MEYKVKCDECGKKIVGMSKKEVNAWLKQHKHYAHENKKNVNLSRQAF